MSDAMHEAAKKLENAIAFLRGQMDRKCLGVDPQDGHPYLDELEANLVAVQSQLAADEKELDEARAEYCEMVEAHRKAVAMLVRAEEAAKLAEELECWTPTVLASPNCACGDCWLRRNKDALLSCLRQLAAACVKESK